MSPSAPEARPTRQFLLLCLPLLAIAFAIWTVFGQAVALPVVGFANLFLGWWMPELVEYMSAHPEGALLVSTYGDLNGQILPAADAGGNLGFIISTMGLSYSLPFYTALYFATPRDSYAAGYFKGCVLLYALILFGLISLALKELMLNLGEVFHNAGVAFLPPNGIIAILFQLNTLIIPTLAPPLIWIGQSRNTALLEGLFPEDDNEEEMQNP